MTYPAIILDFHLSLDNIHRQNHGCEVMENCTDLQKVIQTTNACQRNAFLGVSISPPDQNNTVFARCHRPFYVEFFMDMEFHRLPADAAKVKDYINNQWLLTNQSIDSWDVSSESRFLMVSMEF